MSEERSKHHAKGKKTKSLRVQLVNSISRLIIYTILAISLLTVGILYFNYDTQIREDNQNMTSLISNNLSVFVDKSFKVTEGISLNNDILTMNTAKQNEVLKQYIDKNDYFELLYVQDASGMQTGRSDGGTLANRSDRWWYKELQEKNNKAFVSKAFYSATSNNSVASVFVPLYKNNQVIGSIGANLKLTYLQDLINKYKSNEKERYSFVIDGEGNVIAHPDSKAISEMYNYKNMTKQINSNGVTTQEKLDASEGYKEMVTSVMNGKSGTVTFKDGGTSYYGSYTPITLDGESSSWSVITVQKASAARAVIYKIINFIIIIGVLLILISIINGIRIANKITKPIISLSEYLKITAEGDFTKHFETKEDNNEIRLLSESYNEMVSKVSHLIGNARNLSNDIRHSSGVLDSQTEQTKRVSMEINTAISEIAEGATNQAQDSDKSAKLASDMNDQFKVLTAKSRNLIDKAKSSSKTIDESKVKVDELQDKTKKSVNMIEQTENSVEQLNNKSKNIETILETLNNIAKQTKLLSLNASIEAQRAGESGKSFSIVANEIQKLSVESAQSTSEIAGIIEEIQNEISKSANMMRQVKGVSNEQFEAVNEVNDVFDKITDTVTEISDTISEMTDYTIQMDKDNDNILESINNIAAVSEETAACSEEVNASINEQTIAVEEVASQAEELKHKAEELEKEISIFKI